MKLILTNLTTNQSLEIDIFKDGDIQMDILSVGVVEPLLYKNDNSRSITIELNENNKLFFYGITRSDSDYKNNNFNFNFKNEFYLYNDYDLVDSGYFIVDKITLSEIIIHLNSKFGELQFQLANGDYLDPLNTILGTYTMLKNLKVDLTDSEGNIIEYIINKDLIKKCFNNPNDAIYSTYKDYTKEGNPSVTESVITFIPTYQGTYDFFDNKSTYYYDGKLVIQVDELKNILSNNLGLKFFYTSDLIDENSRTFELSDKLLLNNTSTDIYGDYRSYYQRPVVNLKFLFCKILEYIENLGYKIDLDSDYFNTITPYFGLTWLCLINMIIKDLNSYIIGPKLNLPILRSYAYTYPTNPIANVCSGYNGIYLTLPGLKGWCYKTETSQADSVNSMRFFRRNPNFNITTTIDALESEYESIQLNISPLILLYALTFQTNLSSVLYFQPAGSNLIYNINIELQDSSGTWLIIESTSVDLNFLLDIENRGQILNISVTRPSPFDTVVIPITQSGFTSISYIDDINITPYVWSPINRNATFNVIVPNKNTRISLTPSDNFTLYGITYLDSDINTNPFLFALRPHQLMYQFEMINQLGLSINYNGFTNDNSSLEVRSGSTLNWSKIMHSETTFQKFLNDYCKTFGLIPFCTPDGTFHIYSRNKFYYTDFSIDLKDRVIDDKTFLIKPIPFNYSKYNLGLSATDSYIEKQYEIKTNRLYGLKSLPTSNKLSIEEKNGIPDNIFETSIITQKFDIGYNGRSNTPMSDNKKLVHNYTESNSISSASMQLIYLDKDNRTTGKGFYIISDDDNYQLSNGFLFYDWVHSKSPNDEYWFNHATIGLNIPRTYNIINNKFGLQFLSTSINYSDIIPENETIYYKMHKAYLDDLFNYLTRIITANIYLNDTLIKDINRKLYLFEGQVVNIFKVYAYCYGRPGIYRVDMVTINDYNNYTGGLDFLNKWFYYFFPDNNLILSSDYPRDIYFNDILESQGVSCIIPMTGVSYILVGLYYPTADNPSAIVPTLTNFVNNNSFLLSTNNYIQIMLPSATTSYRWSFDLNADGTKISTISGIVGAMNLYNWNLMLNTGFGVVPYDPTTTEYLLVNGATPLNEYPYPTNIDELIFYDSSKYGFYKAETSYGNTGEQLISYTTSNTISTTLDCNYPIASTYYIYDLTTNNLVTLGCPTSILVNYQDLDTFFDNMETQFPFPTTYDWYMLRDNTGAENFSWYKVTNIDNSVINYINGSVNNYYPNGDVIWHSLGIPNKIDCIYNQLYFRLALSNSRLLGLITEITWEDTNYNIIQSIDNIQGNYDYIFDNPNNTEIESFDSTLVRLKYCNYPNSIQTANNGIIIQPAPSLTIRIPTLSFQINQLIPVSNSYLEYIDSNISDRNSIFIVFNNITQDTLVVAGTTGGRLVQYTLLLSNGAIQAILLPLLISGITLAYNTIQLLNPSTGDTIANYLSFDFIRVQGGLTINFEAGIYIMPCQPDPVDTTLIVIVDPGTIIGLGLDNIVNENSLMNISLFDSNFNIVQSLHSRGADIYTFSNLSPGTYYFGACSSNNNARYSYWNYPLQVGNTYEISFDNNPSFTHNFNNDIAMPATLVPQSIFPVSNDSAWFLLSNITTQGNLLMVYYSSKFNPTQNALFTPTLSMVIGVIGIISGGHKLYSILDPGTLLYQYSTMVPTGYLETEIGLCYDNYNIFDYTNITLPITSSVPSRFAVVNNLSTWNQLSSYNQYYPKWSLGGFNFIAYNSPTAASSSVCIMNDYNPQGLDSHNYLNIWDITQKYTSIRYSGSLDITNMGFKSDSYLSKSYGWLNNQMVIFGSLNNWQYSSNANILIYNTNYINNNLVKGIGNIIPGQSFQSLTLFETSEGSITYLMGLNWQAIADGSVNNNLWLDTTLTNRSGLTQNFPAGTNPFLVTNQIPTTDRFLATLN